MRVIIISQSGACSHHRGRAGLRGTGLVVAGGPATHAVVGHEGGAGAHGRQLGGGEGWGGVGWGGMGSRQKLTRGWQTPEQAAQSSCSLAHSRGSQPSHCPQALQRARSSGSTTAHVVAAADLGAAGVRVAGGHVQRVVLCRRSGGGLKTEATWRGVAGTQGPNRWQAVPVIAALHGMQQGRAGGQGRAPDSGV